MSILNFPSAVGQTLAQAAQFTFGHTDQVFRSSALPKPVRDTYQAVRDFTTPNVPQSPQVLEPIHQDPALVSAAGGASSEGQGFSLSSLMMGTGIVVFGVGAGLLFFSGAASPETGGGSLLGIPPSAVLMVGGGLLMTGGIVFNAFFEDEKILAGTF